MDDKCDVARGVCGAEVVAWFFPNADGSLCMDAVRHNPNYPGAVAVMSVAQHIRLMAEKDAEIDRLSGIISHVRLQASIQAQEARTQKSIVSEIGKLIGHEDDWDMVGAVRATLSQHSAPAERGVVDGILKLILDECKYWQHRDEARRGNFASLYASAQEVARLNPAPAESTQCDTCHGQGEVFTGEVQSFGYMSMQPPEPIMEVCPECSGESVQRQHPDDAAVDRFAGVMKAKLAKSRAKGRGGWEDKSQCSAEYLSELLRGHVAKGDPVDVANFCMMLQQRDEAIQSDESECDRLGQANEKLCARVKELKAEVDALKQQPAAVGVPEVSLHRAITHYEAALSAAFPSGSSGAVFSQWNEARRVIAAAPAPVQPEECCHEFVPFQAACTKCGEPYKLIGRDQLCAELSALKSQQAEQKPGDRDPAHTLFNEIRGSMPVNEDDEPTRYIITEQQLQRIRALEFGAPQPAPSPAAKLVGVPVELLGRVASMLSRPTVHSPESVAKDAAELRALLAADTDTAQQQETKA